MEDLKRFTAFLIPALPAQMAIEATPRERVRVRRRHASEPPDKDARPTLSGARLLLPADEDARLGIAPMGFGVHRVTATTSTNGTDSLLEYSRKSCWESYAREKETIVLKLDTKTLLSEICILNKNACTVDVSIAVDDRPRSYINIKRLQHMPHSREVRVKVGFFPCCFVQFEFRRLSQPCLAIYGIKLKGVASRAIEQDSGPSLCNVLSHTTEHLLFGPSLRMSLPHRDCLSEELSGSPEWMDRQRPHLLDERIARLERSLFSTST